MKKHLIILFIASVIVRIIYVWMFHTWEPHYGMSPHYAELAYMLATGSGYNRLPLKHDLDRTLNSLSIELDKKGEKIHPSTELPFDRNNTIAEYWRPPGYPFFLFLIYELFGEPLFFYATLFQALIGSFLPVVIYFIGIKLFNKKIAICSMWLSAVYLPLLFIQLQPLPDGFQILMLMLALYFFIYSILDKRPAWFPLCGLIIGIGFLFRAEIFALIPLFSLILLALCRPVKLAIKGTIAICFCAAIFITPWVVRNHNTTGHWYITTGSGAVAWLGIAERNNDWGAVLQDAHVHWMAREHGFDSAVTPDADKWLHQKVRIAFKEDPLYFVVGAIYRLPEVFATPFHWGYTNPARTKGFRSHFRLKENLDFFQTIFQNKAYILKAFWDRWITAFTSLVATLSMIFMGIKCRHDPKKLILFLSIPVSFMLLRIGIRSLPRYLTMLIPFQLIALSFMFFGVKKYFSRKRTLQSKGEEEMVMQ